MVELGDTLTGSGSQRDSSPGRRSPPPAPESARCPSQKGMARRGRRPGSCSRCFWSWWERWSWWCPTPEDGPRPCCCCPAEGDQGSWEVRCKCPTASHFEREGWTVGGGLRPEREELRAWSRATRSYPACPGSWSSPWAPPPHRLALGPATGAQRTEEGPNRPPPLPAVSLSQITRRCRH